jgi:AP-3 complex subunit delta-1
MFEKTLTDLIKGIRANPSGEPEFIATCIAECRQELLSVEPSVKQMAVLKLTYLQMLGHDVAWAAFHCVDVMSSPRFRAKRIGFLGAAQTFNESTDVLLLTTNLFRKAFASSTQHEASIAVGCLARIATPDLARDLMGDVTNMLGSSRPLLRKKAVLALYRLLQRLPEALVPAFPRLRERLDDPDPSVVACTVNVLTELATDNPKGYLGLAPALYKASTTPPPPERCRQPSLSRPASHTLAHPLELRGLPPSLLPNPHATPRPRVQVLTTSSSNWTLIKVVKFLRQLVPHEPRLAKKLVQPLTHLIDSTPAKSLQFECLYTVRAPPRHRPNSTTPPQRASAPRPRGAAAQRCTGQQPSPTVAAFAPLAR